ncbi:MAG: hypothetical protein EHM42_02120 [Planctomycetaceae bacterium]|nr:MAG: hypothetical protein EHM42_02120 [Planctomycetaceae bacterium]
MPRNCSILLLGCVCTALCALIVTPLHQPVSAQTAPETSSENSPKTARPEPKPDCRASQLAALEDFNSLIGNWRGVAQPQRGSNKGSWSESAEWVWELSKHSAAIRYNVTEGRQFTSGLLTFEPDEELYVFDGTLPDQTQRRYRGTLAGNKLTLESEPDDAGLRHQIVITRLNDKRTLVLYQSRTAKQQQFARVAEVGYTREGTKLAEEGSDGPLCIVTDGKGSMKVEYKGMTYWVCCTGCREAFDDDPEGIIASAAERVRKKREKKRK